MPPVDRPYLTRRLAGVDQALGEGQAREPAELLDRLRERLDRLDPNHPSARPWDKPPEPAEPAEPADEVTRPAERPPDSRSESPSRRKNGADQSSDHKPVDQDAGQPPTATQAAEPVTATSIDGQSQVVDIGRASKPERYRPWFADEPGAPWFIE